MLGPIQMPGEIKQLPSQNTDFVQNIARHKNITLFQGTDQYPG